MFGEQGEGAHSAALHLPGADGQQQRLGRQQRRRRRRQWLAHLLHEPLQVPHDRQVALGVEILALLGRETRGEATGHRVGVDCCRWGLGAAGVWAEVTCSTLGVAENEMCDARVPAAPKLRRRAA